MLTAAIKAAADKDFGGSPDGAQSIEDMRAISAPSFEKCLLLGLLFIIMIFDCTDCNDEPKNYHNTAQIICN